MSYNGEDMVGMSDFDMLEQDNEQLQSRVRDLERQLAEAKVLIRDCRLFVGNLPLTDESVRLYKRLQKADPFVPSKGNTR